MTDTSAPSSPGEPVPTGPDVSGPGECGALVSTPTVPLLDEATLPDRPVPLLRQWWDAAAAAGVADPNAMVLATADADGTPSARTVLATVIDEAGITFHSSDPSRKTLDLAVNPRASVVFGWYPAGRQVAVAGTVERLADPAVDAAFARRPRALQLLAWVYHHAPASVDAGTVAQLTAEQDRHWGDAAPLRPPGWLGYRLRPAVVDFWRGSHGGSTAGRPNERVRYLADGPGWRRMRVLP